ncbi:hypothetical protein [Blastococcus sp. SYSU D00813]
MTTRIRRSLATAAFVAAALAVPAGVAQAAPSGCAPGFSDPGPVTFDESLREPRIVAGLGAGAFTEDDLELAFASLDRNGDGTICLKAVSNLRGNSGKHWAFFYLAQDNR